MHIRIKNNNLTNRLVQRLIIAVDFVVLWTLLFFVVGTIPQSEGWDEEKVRAFWMIFIWLTFKTIFKRDKQSY